MNKWQADYKRMSGLTWNWIEGAIRLLFRPHLRFCFYGRIASGCKVKTTAILFNIAKRQLGQKYGLEIEFTNIGEGINLIHPFNITVNAGSVIGKNATLFKGCTIGSIRSGKRAGVPTIGDNVTICTNAFVCGGIRIGNNVLIAANAFINFDVPDNSIVIGNPAIIRYKENPSQDYL
ncbi:serine acetyltransferase [Pelosinus sp. sgz500959]|uniref:serine acetyltransferase n=1 Tax=Pelosinus sp. sgz500959 TaxID=3242472 RepID=UPI00366B3506